MTLNSILSIRASNIHTEVCSLCRCKYGYDYILALDGYYYLLKTSADKFGNQKLDSGEYQSQVIKKSPTYKIPLIESLTEMLWDASLYTVYPTVKNISLH